MKQRRKNSPALAALFLMCSPSILFSQTGSGVSPGLHPVVPAVRTGLRPVLDGRVLNDPAYAQALVLDEFWQTNPDDGLPATEKTEVRIVYSSDTLYFGVVCFDRSPLELVIAENRRDGPLAETDCIQIILDTYFDRQNGFIFGTNPTGLEYDAQVSKEGELSMLAQTTGSTGGFNLNWDGAWEVRTSTGDYGWSAEFAIPFRTLRYGTSSPQTWGLNIQRNIRRRKETSYWAKVPRQFNIYRVSYAGELQNLDIPIPQNLKMMPYALGSSRLHGDPPNKGEIGLDMKYSVTPSLTLDATYNTDFAQVEVDEQQFNLDRFDLFFPEKRPFFLENAGIFDVGSPGEVELFFSRRIGIGPGGRVIPIVGGGRLSGKIGGTAVGILDIQTEAVDSIAPSNNFFAARVNQEFPNRSALGGLLVNRMGSTGSDYNRILAFDGRLGIGEYNQLLGWAAGNFASSNQDRLHAFRAGFSHQSPGWTVETYYTEIAENFNPDMSFLRRRSYRKTETVVLRRYRPDDFIGIQEMRPHISYRSFWNFTGFQETGFLHFDCHWEFKTGDEIHTGINFKKDGVVTPFAIYPGIIIPSATYSNAEFQLVLRSNQGATVSTDGMYYYGGFFGGTYFSMNPSVRARSGDRFNVQMSWSYTNARLPEGSFVTDIVRTRVSYSFTPRMFIQGLVQYNDLLDTWSANIRFGWLQSSNTGLFIVLNELRDAFQGLGPVQDRSVVVKYTHLFELLD